MKRGAPINNTVKKIQPECFANGRYVAPNKKEIHFKDIIASEAEYAEGLSSVWHYHENPHFSHILSGGSIEVREYDTQFQTSGTSLYYNPCLLHKNEDYRPGTRIFNLELQPSFFKRNGLAYSEATDYLSLEDAHFKRILIVKILNESYLNDAQSEISIEQLCTLLCEQQENGRITKNSHWSSMLREYLHENWDQVFGLAELAAHVDIHPVNISRYFSKYFNCSLGEYIRRIKVERSLPFIRNNRYSLTEIAYECGFTDQSHFTRTFKQITGILPKQYRGL